MLNLPQRYDRYRQEYRSLHHQPAMQCLPHHHGVDADFVQTQFTQLSRRSRRLSHVQLLPYQQQRNHSLALCRLPAGLRRMPRRAIQTERSRQRNRRHQ